MAVMKDAWSDAGKITPLATSSALSGGMATAARRHPPPCQIAWRSIVPIEAEIGCGR